MSTEYYFISDLHIGGDGELDNCEFEQELIGFLQRLEKKNKGTELIIVGDAFAFWEMGEGNALQKLQKIVRNHKSLFEQFRRTGKNIKITLIPGNHDHELAHKPNYKAFLKRYNINLIQKVHITRRIDGKRIYIEHGSQNDANNRVEDYGNPKEKPIGFYSANRIVRKASRHSELGKFSWLKEIESVYPNEEIPRWLFSNYFYREMNPLLRLPMLPFLLFFGASFILLLGTLLQSTGILRTHLFTRQTLDNLWILGDFLWVIIVVNFILILLLAVISVPLVLIMKDIKRTISRYGLPNDLLKVHKDRIYMSAARKVFRSKSNVSIYIYGHTHVPSVNRIDSKHVVINTGSWLKRLTRLPSRFFLLPAVYIPSYRLNYFRIQKKNDRIEILYRQLPKRIRPKLTWLQRFAIVTKRKSDRLKIPRRTYLEL